MKIYIIYELFLCLLVVTFCPPGGFMLTVPSHNLHCYPHHQISSYEQVQVRASPGTCCPWAHSPSKYVNILNFLGQHASSPSGVLWSSSLNHQHWSSTLQDALSFHYGGIMRLDTIQYIIFHGYCYPNRALLHDKLLHVTTCQTSVEPFGLTLDWLARDMLGVDASSSICRSSHLLLIPWAQLPDRCVVGITTVVVVVVSWVEENRREVIEE